MNKQSNDGVQTEVRRSVSKKRPVTQAPFLEIGISIN